MSLLKRERMEHKVFMLVNVQCANVAFEQIVGNPMGLKRLKRSEDTPTNVLDNSKFYFCRHDSS